MEMNMPPRWGFSSLGSVAITMSLLRS